MPNPPRARKDCYPRPVTAASRAAGVKSQPARARSLVALLCLAACGPPHVDARAVWLTARRGEGGERTLAIYDAGLLSARALRPATPDPGADDLPLILELEPRGRGALVRAADGGWQHELGDSTGLLRAGYIDLAGERALPLLLPAGRQPDEVAFAATGGALWWTDGCPAELKLVPTSPRVAAPVTGDPRAVAPLAWPLGGGCGERWGAVSASDAPILFAVEAVPESGALRPGPEGHVLAIQYPAPAGGYDSAPALTLAGAGRLPPGDHDRLDRARCAAPGPSCGLGVVDPDGEALTIAVDTPECRLWRWSRLTGEGACAVPADGFGALQPWTLLAAISPRHYVFRDGLVIRRFDWTTGELAARPLVGDTSEMFALTVDDGRAALFATIRGFVLRVDDRGLELLGVEQRACPGFQAPVASPSGNYVAWTCTLDGTDGDDGLGAGEVVRVSAAGTERLQGVPMWALAIDDDGDLLLHSRGDQDFSFELLLPPDPPRNLYVLTGDGELARVDPIEPDPELHRGLGRGVFRWIAAQAL